ncbi:hypothetical protein HWV62_24424 [Athelia sp. TMB]|nr:hypothetical protein HWV62_24424 [Athelia sp. TMB]
MHPRNAPRERGLFSHRALINGLRLLWVLVVLWCEVGAFFYALADCKWPDAPLIQHGTAAPTHVLLISDPQVAPRPLLPPSPRALREALIRADMRKAWRLTQRLAPAAVVCLGDMLASGRTAKSDEEYAAMVAAARGVLELDGRVPMYYVPGNNDVGLGRSPTISTATRTRFVRHFGPLNQVLRLAGHDLVLLDAPGLVEEDYARHAAGATPFAQYTGAPGGPVEFIKTLPASAAPRILLTHIPLAHPEAGACGPRREKGTLRRGVGKGWQNTLDKATTEFLLRGVRPAGVFSGDDRDYCEHTHAGAGGNGTREVTVKSFSRAANIRRPGFQLLSLVPPAGGAGRTFADAPCSLPDRYRLLHTLYLPLSILTLLALGVAHLSRRRAPPLRLAPFAPPPPLSASPDGGSTPWGPLSPFTPRPPAMSVRIPSVRSATASTSASGTDTPLLTPDDREDAPWAGDESQFFPPQYALRRSGEQHLRPAHWPTGEHADDDEDAVGFYFEKGPAHSRANSVGTAYFAPPPPPGDAAARTEAWAWSCAFVLRGRVRRITLRAPTLESLLNVREALGWAPTRGAGGVARGMLGDALRVLAPAVAAWWVVVSLVI